MDAPFGPQRTRNPLKALLLFAVYFASAKLGLRLAFVHASATAVWPPTGIALAAFLLLGYRFWPAVFLGAFLANLTTAGDAATSICIAAGNTLEGLLGAALLNRYAGGPRALERAQGVFKFVLFAGILGTMASAFIGVTSLSLLGFAPWTSYGAIALTWWMGDMAGALMVAPPLLLWATQPEFSWKRAAQTLLPFLVLALTGLAVFAQWLPWGTQGLPLPFLCIPPLIWIAVRFGPRETATASLLLSALAIWATLRGDGPFNGFPTNESLLLLQAYMAVCAVTSLALAAAVSERNLAEQNLARIQKAEEALLNSEKHFRAMIENAQDIVTILDAQGTILFESPSILPALGYGPSELEGVNAFSLIHPDDVARVQEKFKAVLADPGRPQSVRFRFRHKNGNWRELESIGKNMLQEPAVQGVIVNSRDITDREAAFLSALESEERFRQLAEATQEGVLVSEEGRILNANLTFARMFGYDWKEVLGKNSVDFVAHGDRPWAAQKISAGYEKTYEITGLRKDGSTFPMEVTGKTVPYHGRTARVTTLRDVTEHKQFIKTLRESEERFRLLVENIKDYAIFLLDPEGRVVTWNEGAQRIIGYNAVEIVGRSFSCFYVPEDVERRHPEELLKAAAEQGRVEEEGWRVRKDGSRFWANTIVTPLKNEKGGLRGFAKVTQDITERRRVEDLLRSNTELQQFANVASHDLQEPLRMVSNYVQLLAERYKGKLDADADEFIGFAVDGAKRMHLLINGLLEYARVESRGKPFQPVDFQKVFNDTLSNLKVKIEETRAKISHGPLPRVMGDGLQMGQLLQNLFGNSLKFKGTRPPEIHFSAEQKGKEWVFACRDNGIGIDAKYFDRIFVIFQRLHARSEYEGMGLGLAICKRIVERHGGRIWVESEPGEGSTFYFTLPERN